MKNVVIACLFGLLFTIGTGASLQHCRVPKGDLLVKRLRCLEVSTTISTGFYLCAGAILHHAANHFEAARKQVE
jgi:hypothetical protein